MSLVGEEVNSLALSQEYFRSPDSYTPFTPTHRDRKIIIGCIDPREIEYTEATHHKVVIQTGGAGTGVEMDGAIAFTAEEDEVVTLEESLARDQEQDVWSMYMLGVHYRCKFIAGMAVVLTEMGDPSEQTLADLEASRRILGVEEVVNPSRQTLTRIAAHRLLESVVERDSMEHLVDHIDKVHPDHTNVVDMHGENVAQMYIKNFHPYFGINRYRKPHKYAHMVQGYHDNVAALAMAIRNNPALTEEQRVLRLNAMLLRSAATQTVLTRDNIDEMTFLHVHPSAKSPKGIEITEVAA